MTFNVADALMVVQLYKCRGDSDEADCCCVSLFGDSDVSLYVTEKSVYVTLTNVWSQL